MTMPTPTPVPMPVSATAAAPPADLREYEFSYSRSTGKMRFRLDGQEWLVDRLVGQWEFVQSIRATGRFIVRCALVLQPGLDGLTAYVFVPDGKPASRAPDFQACDLKTHDNHDTCLVATTNPFPQGRETHWRLCYAREKARTNEPCWRLRDERTDELWFVNDYQGVVNINYFDRGSHVFVDGACTVDEKGVAHFA